MPSHPLVKHWLAVARNKLSPPPVFRSALAELGRLLIYEATAQGDWLPVLEGQAETPCGVADVSFLDPGRPVKARVSSCTSATGETGVCKRQERMKSASVPQRCKKIGTKSCSPGARQISLYTCSQGAAHKWLVRTTPNMARVTIAMVYVIWVSPGAVSKGQGFS